MQHERLSWTPGPESGVSRYARDRPPSKLLLSRREVIVSTDVVVAVPDDLEILLDLARSQFLEHDIEVSSSETRQAVAAALADPALGLFLIAREERQPVGFAYVSWTWALEHGGRSAWLEELFVIPARRNAGIGRSILDVAIARVDSLGGAAIDLEVEHGHERAERLYRREGFRPLRRSRWVLPIRKD